MRRGGLILATVMCALLALRCTDWAMQLSVRALNPPSGDGSLGEVGIMVAAFGSGALAVVSGLFALYFGLKLRQRP